MPNPDIFAIEIDGIRAGGSSSPLMVTDVDWGPAAIKTNDIELVGRDGIMPGRDLLGAQIITFKFSTNLKPSPEALQDALALQEKIFAVWQDPGRRAPGAVTELVYMVEGGRIRRVYGRPRDISGFTTEVIARRGAGQITAQFIVTRPGSHGDQRQVRIDAVPASSGGLIAPLVAPLTTQKTGAVRQGLIEVTGGAEALPEIRFRGPSTDPSIRSDDGRWRIGLMGTLAYDRTITIDLARNRFALPGNVTFTFDSNLTGATLQPGTNSLTYEAADPTGTSYALIRWRDAFTTF